MNKKVWVIGIASVLAVLVVWLPFLLHIKLPSWGTDFSQGMQTVFANFDGPNYIIVSKTWYDKALIGKSYSLPQPLEYYAAHLPLYPALVSVLNKVFVGTWSMLLVTLVGLVLASLSVYQLFKSTKAKSPLWLALVFIFFPARWVVVRSVGSPEPWFIFFIVMSVLNFKKEKYWLAGIWGVLAQLTKSPGILLFASYGVYFLLETITNKKIAWRKWLKATPLLLIPLSVFPLFYFYQMRTGDFLAYFHSGDNFHLFWPPFSAFTPLGQHWVGDFWLEDIIWLWLVYGLGIVNLWKKGWKVEASFASVFFATTLFVAHRDIARYILPIAPFVVLGWEDVINRKEFKWLFVLLLIPIHFYTWNFILHNTAPIADWTPYL